MMKIVNIFLISIAIFLYCVFSLAGSLHAEDNKFYHINLFYEQGKLKLKNIAVFQGYIPQEPQEGDYRVELMSISGTTLYTDHFQIPLSIHGEQIDTRTGKSIPTSLNIESTDVRLSIPYFSKGKVANIYDLGDRKVLVIPVQQFAEVTPTPNPPQKFVPTVEKKSGGDSLFLFLGLGSLVVAGAGLFIYWQVKRRN